MIPIRSTMIVVNICVCGAMLMCIVAAADAVPPQERARSEAAKIIGPEKSAYSQVWCGYCHVLEASVWRQSKHAIGFSLTHKTDQTAQILGALDLRSMKRDGDCRRCHYTSVLSGGQLRPAWGVTCESCHGAAVDWINVHNRRDGTLNGELLIWGTGKSGKSEKPVSRAQRLSKARQQGMIDSEQLYALVKRCYGCHLVDDERLINKTVHTDGARFILPGWLDGEVRHRFASSPGAPTHPSNPPLAIERKRVIYVLGSLVELESTMRALSKVNETGSKYHRVLIDRANSARSRVKAVADLAALPHVASALAVVPPDLTTASTIDPAWANEIAGIASQFVTDTSGATMQQIDELIPHEYRGSVYSLRGVP